MNEITQEIQASDSKAFPLSFRQRLTYGIFIVAAPIMDFTFVGIMKPEWQSGEFSDYIHLFLLPEASFVFFPFLAYSVVSYILLLVNTDRFAKSFLVRFGIYTGAFLALQYSILTIFALDLSPTFILVVLLYFSPFIVTRVYRWLRSKWNAVLMGYIALGIGLVILFASMISLDSSAVFILLLFLGIAAPFLAFRIASQAMLWLIKNHEGKIVISRGLGFVAWLAAYAYALRFNILKMYELYAALPPRPPDCYIATAAAQGHPRFVRSRVVELRVGKHVRINRQLQRLKCFELTLMVLSPSLHGFIRRVYDVVGKRLAVRISNPYLADLAYLLLVPEEWISFLALKLFVPEVEVISKRIYFR
ncbi:hypothetical protein ANAEL_00381 [Anaerolineales bacterium]|nr:hypothetical protein ANAEL_00381 [Anaerolineales bacterium]